MLHRLCALGPRFFYLPRMLPSTSRCTIAARRLYSDDHLPPREVYIPQPSTKPPPKPAPPPAVSTPPPPSKSPPQVHEPVKPKAEVQKEAHDAHDVENPGPPVTLDYMPVPFQKYQTVYKELQKKFNFYLVVGVGLLGLSLAIAIKEDMFAIEALRPPASYRNRKKAYMSTEKDEKSEPSPPPPAETADEKSEPSPPPPVETTEPEPQAEKTVVATEPEAPQVVAEPPAEEPKVNVAIPIVSGNLHEKTSKDEHARTDT